MLSPLLFGSHCSWPLKFLAASFSVFAFPEKQCLFVGLSSSSFSPLKTASPDCLSRNYNLFVFFLFFFFPILNLRFKVLAACDSFLCVSSLNRYCSVVISARQACLNQSRSMHPPVTQRENCFSSSSTTYLFSGLSDRSIDFDTSFPFLSVCNSRIAAAAAAASGQIPCKRVSDPILDFRSDPFSDLQDFTSDAPGLTSLFRCIHPPTQRKNCCSSSKGFHRLCR